MVQLKPLGVLLSTLFLIVPLTSEKSIDVHYCDKIADYVVKVRGVDISPFPVPRGKKTTFTIAASTDEAVSGGKLEIEVFYFGIHVHNENHDLCKEISCPVSVGDFVLSHSLKLSRFTPPGSYMLKMTMEDENNKRLTCITFDFSIGFVAQESL
ncbi:UNVERIFIED_CONTAM: putative phosphatidylglycerol/phosphatidylinositol transfer protein DDB [Sesamum calycinum]|uniref:Phosphatidylglycerol/phosphatidylinositol transfer protein DDB n=1 Tax=Sesamum calycinum TaxID=2727403 RepID=A0AAW2MZF3_9LAMI